MARDYYDESKPKKKKKEEKKVAVQKQPSSSVSNQAKQNQKSYGTTTPALKQKTTTTPKQNTQNKTVSKPITRQQRQNQKSYGDTNGQQTRRTTTTRQQTAQETQNSAAQRRKNVEANNNLKQTVARQRREERAATSKEMMARREQARQKKMGLAPEDQPTAAQKEAANRAVKNTPALVKKAIKDTIGGHGQTLSDLTELTASSEAGARAKAMKLGYEYNDTEGLAKVKEERRRTVKAAREERERLAKEQEERQREWDEKTKDAGGLEKAYYGAVESGTGMLTDMAVGMGTQAGSLASMFSRTYGTTRGQAEKEGATAPEDRRYALLQAAKEVGTELMFPGAGLAKKAYGRAGASLGEKAASILLKNLKGPSAELASSGTRLLGGVLEENLEEAAGWGLDPLIKEYTYGKNVRNRNMESAKASMRESSEALKANIQNEDDVRAAAAYLSSGDFLEQTRRSYIESGLSENDATEIAEKMRDYLSASISGDTERMAEIEDEVSKRMYGQHRLRDDYSFDELRDTIASTTLLTAATGLPGTVKTSAQGAAIKQELGSEGISALAKTAIDFEDPDVARQAKAMNERIESGNELTNTQVYDLQVAMQEQVKVDNQREKAARSMAGRTIENENLVSPYSVDRNGNIQLDEVTGKAYSESAKKAEGIIKSIKNESKESLTDTQVQDGSRAIAGFQTGVFTVNDANTLNYSNTAVRAAFQAATGINLDQYIVKNRNGSVNIPATNTATKDALFAMAADNLVKSAQAETVNWMDNTKGQVVSQISARMGAEGSAVLQQALDGVDERNRSAYMMTANATDMLYQAARNMGTEWSDVKAEAMKMFPGISESKLQTMYEAGLTDRELANDKLRGRQVNAGESITQMGEQETATGNVFIDTEEPPKGTVIRTFTEIAQNLGADIHLTDEIQNVDGTVIDGANGAYDPKTNTFYLNVSTGIEKNVGYIFMHEVTHYLKANAPEQYLALENLVRERWFRFNPSQMQDAIARKIAAYEKATNGKQVLTEEEALEEIIADAAHEFLNDPNFAQQVAEEDPSLSKAILNSIRNALRMLRQIFGSGTIDDETHMNCLFSEIGILDEAERLWLEAYKQAVRNQAAASYAALSEDCLKLNVEEQEYHTDEQRKIIREYNAAADPNLMQMFEDIRNGKYVKPVEVGTVSPEMAADILDNLPEGVYREGFDPTGYKIVVSTNYYAHVEKRHGKNGTADQTMADDEDKARIGYVINNYDEILPGGRSREYTMQDIDGENINSPAVGFEKTINGTVIGGLAVPDTKAKTLGITSAYINKKKAFQTPDAYAPGQTAETVSESPSVDSITSGAEESKTRFSIDEPVERVKDLIAVHNLKPDDIRNTFELGGFPMPSIAVTKDSMGHDMYGDITLMFHSDTIDPGKRKANQVFGGDAYTPVFPSIRYKPNDEVSRKISDLYYDNAKDVGYDGMRGLYRYAEGIEDELNSAGGEKELIEKAKSDTALMSTFLKINNMDVENIYKRTETKMSEYEVERCEHFINALGEEKLREFEGDGIPHGREMIDHRRTWMQDNLDAVKEAYSDYLKKYFEFTDEDVQNELNNSKMLKFSTFVRDALNYLNNGDTTVKEELDVQATNNAIKEKAIDSGFENWVEDLFAGIEEKQGIRNNKDFFTNMGQRRKWEVLHDPVTLDNVVKVMKSNLDAGANGLLGANPKGAAQKKYRNLNEIRADEDRLQMLPEEEYKKLSEEALDKLTEVCGSIYDHNASKFSNTFGGVLDVGEAIAEILNETRTKAGIQRILTKEYQWRVSDLEMDDLMEAIDAIANVPTGYFEAKPKRAVTFDEVKAAIIPQSTDEDIKTGLADRGVPMYEYDPEVEGDRTEKVNQAASEQKLRFSLTDSEGTELSEGQQTFFSRSKNRNAEGQLKVMLHGTNNEFYEFDPTKAKPGTLGRAFYFSDSASHAGQYGKAYKYYLNLENPLVAGTHNITKDQLRSFVAALAEDEDYGIENYGYDATVDSVTDSVWGGTDFAMLQDLNLTSVGDFAEALKIFNRVNGTEYDGIITPIETVAFYPQQIKRTDNLNPTLSKDTRYSITDSDGNELSDGQVDYFKDSKARDNQGRLVPVYHTTNKGGFMIFDPAFSDDKRSLFFASNWDVSQTYGNYANSRFYYFDINNIDDVEKYLDAYSPDRYFLTQEQFDKAGGWEADFVDFENATDGKQSDFSEYLNNPDGYIAIVGVPDYSPDNRSYADDWVSAASPDELVRELHNHFGWQRDNYRTGTQHGYYACYLNLKNPLIIDCEGANWDSIPEDGFSSIFISYDGDFIYVDGDNIVYTLEGLREYYGEGFADAAEDWIEKHEGDEETLSYGDNIYTYWDAAFDPEEEGHYPGEMTTREYAEEAYYQGHDGVIFKNLVDIGGSSEFDGMEEMSDIYIAFSSEQVKDIRNLNPTESPDIRYSIIDEDDALSNLASQDAIDNSREALEYYERLYEMRAPEVEMYFNTPQDEEQISEFYAALNADENVPFDDPVLEEGRVRIAKSKRDFFNNVNTKWRETWTTGGEVLDLKSVEKEIRNLVKSAMANSDTDAKYRQDTINRTLIDVREAYQLMKQDRTDIASALLYRSAQNMIGNLEFIQDDGTFEEYKAIRSYLRSTKITLDDRFWNEETFREFRKSHFGTLRLAKGLKSDVDKIYQELEEQFPAAFSEAERERLGFGDSEEDLLEHIGYVVDQNVKPFMVAYSSEEAAELASNIASQLYDIMELGRPIESLGDQLDNKGRRRLEGVYQDMENAEARYLNDLESTRSEYDERINRMREDHRSDLDMLDYQTKMMKVRHEEALQKLAERKDKQAERKIAKLKEKQREKEQKRKERQEHKSKFDRIKDNYDWLTQRVLDPTKDKNVPEEFRKSLAEFLQTLDLQTERSKRLEERTGHVAQKTFKMRELKDRLNALAQSKGEDGSSIFEIDANVAYILDALTEKLEKNGNTIDALDEHDISEIDILMKAIRHNLTRVNQIRIEDKRVEIATIGGEVIEDQLKRVQKHGAAKTYGGAKGALDVINESALTPAYFFGRLGDGMNSMYEELRYKGFDSYIRNEKLITDRLAGILGKYYKNGGLLRKNRPKPGSMIEEWRDDRSAHTIELTNGSVTMTVAQMMSLYCLSQRQQAMTHMLRGGIHVTPIQTGSKVQAAKDKVKGKVESSESVVLNEADLQKIISELTPEQIKVAQELQQLMAVDMAKLGNEAHREMYGYEIFNDPNYFPIKVRGNEIATDINNIGDVIEKIKSFGPSKPLTPNASNIIEVDDIFTVTADHCNGMNLYNAYLVPISDFMRVYNYKQMMEDGRSLSVKDAIEQAHTKKALTYITNFLKDLNGIKPTQRGGLEDIMNKAIGTAKKTAVFGNIRVALQQPTAIVRALAVMDPKHFVPILKLRPEKGVREEMYKYCPIAQWKSWGYYDTYMGRDIEDVMMNNWSASDVALSGLYGELDNWTWSLIWRAVKSEMHEAHPDMNMKSEEFLQMCGKRASEVFDKTQVVDSTFHRSDAMRSKQVAVKTFTAFMAEPTLTLNVFRAGLYDAREAWLDGDKGKAAKIFNRALSVIVLQAAVVSAAQAFADAWRGKDPGLPWDDDDDDEENGYFVRWLHNYVYNLFDQLHLENNMYLVKDVTPYLNYMISKAADYFDVNPTLRAVMGWDQDYLYSQNNLVFSGLENTANGFAQVFKKLQKGDDYDKDWYDIIQKTSSGVGTFIGFPLGTLMRDTKPIWKAIAASAYAADSTDVTEVKKSRQISGVKDGSTVDNILNHFGINLTENEQMARAEDKAVKARSKKAEEIAGKTDNLTGEARDKKVWSAVTTYIKSAEGDKSYTDLITSGDYDAIDKYRDMYIAAGGDTAYFDERVMAESKKALKKSIKYDPTDEEVEAQENIKNYMLSNGMSESELSEMVYKSDTAKDMKIAFRINDKDAMMETLLPLVRAGLTYEDLERIWNNRNRIDVKKYKDSGGRYASRLKSTGVYNWPVTGTITSRFGRRSSPGGIGSTNHKGLDIGANMGDPVAASDGGVVIYAGWDGGYGKCVRIQHDDGTVTEYAHLSWWDAQKGDTVAQGQIIGNVGSTGNSTGPHLHFGVMKNGSYIDPENYLH